MGSGEPGRPATEDVFNTSHPNPRIASELAGAAMLERGVNVSVMRLPQVHDTVKQGLITPLIDLAREKGVSAYVGDGQNRYPAAHVLDVAPLYRLALEMGEAGARYNAVDEEGIAVVDIAQAIGKGLGIPVVSMSSRGRGRPFRLARGLHRDGHAGLERLDARAARMAPDRPRADLRTSNGCATSAPSAADRDSVQAAGRNLFPALHIGIPNGSGSQRGADDEHGARDDVRHRDERGALGDGSGRGAARKQGGPVPPPPEWKEHVKEYFNTDTTPGEALPSASHEAKELDNEGGDPA